MQIILYKIFQHRFRLVLLISAVLFFNFMTGTGLVFPSLQDSSHALVFGMATSLLLHAIIPAEPITSRKRLQYVMLICLAAFMFGILIEFVQPFFGRNKSLLDASYNLAGCCIAGLLYWRQHTRLKHTRTALLITSTALIIACLALPASKLVLVLQRKLAMPMLVGFDADWERHIRSINDGTHLSIVNAPSEWNTTSRVGKFKLGNASYPGLSFPHIYHDWSDYSHLTFSVFSNNPQTLTMHLRIHDTRHNNQYRDRFNRSLKIKPGLSVFNIDLETIKNSPRSRDLNLEKIASLALFMVRPERPITLYIDDIQLY